MKRIAPYRNETDCALSQLRRRFACVHQGRVAREAVIFRLHGIRLNTAARDPLNPYAASP
jgi:hypothetical protein